MDGAYGGTVARSGGLCELDEVVGGADQRPLGPHFLDAPQQELAEAPCLLDLSEHRLDDLLPQPIPASPSSPLELGAHRQGERAALAAPFRWAIGTPRGDAGGDAARAECREVGLAQIAAVGRYLDRRAAQVGGDVVDERHDLPVIARRLDQAVGEDDLRAT